MKQTRSLGFTLIELILVLAILLILVSLFGNALSSAKSSASRMHCASNLRELGFAAAAYCDANAQHFFPYLLGQKGGGRLYWFGWLEMGDEGNREFDITQSPLWDHFSGMEIELCREFKYHHPLYKPKARGASFGFGYNLHLSSGVFGSQSARRLSDIAHPSQIALFADAAQINDFQAPARWDNPLIEEFYYVNDGGALYANGHFRHQNRANVAFLDGHVEAIHAAADSRDPRLPSMHLARIPKENLIP